MKEQKPHGVIKHNGHYKDIFTFGGNRLSDCFYFYIYLNVHSIHELLIRCSKRPKFKKHYSLNPFKRKELNIEISEIVYPFQTEDDEIFYRFPYITFSNSRPLSNLLKNKISLKKFLRIKSDDLFISRITNLWKEIILKVSYIADAE